ncbi:hypothetical protein Salat_2405300 [Sesamum alatum]|uniref:Uncharacterized protein n=1 Tax=Sesamum alatum TaxID=300844 RepID=A0AAE1XYG0_9LAMI|nr:hypothetical protein Salat_2405300 [Sesamum alatum]
MNVRIAQLSRALRGGSTSVVAGRSSEADTSATPYVPSQNSSDPQSSVVVLWSRLFWPKGLRSLLALRRLLKRSPLRSRRMLVHPRNANANIRNIVARAPTSQANVVDHVLSVGLLRTLLRKRKTPSI